MKTIPRIQSKHACLVIGVALALSSLAAQAGDPYSMSSGDYSENFANIASTLEWPDGFGTKPWVGVGTSSTSVPIPDPRNITRSSATFTSGGTGGVQRGTSNIVLLATGADNTNASAIDLSLDFTNRLAGNFSFDAGAVNNTTGNRKASLRVYWSTDSTTWTELTGTNLPFEATNNVTANASISVSLPAALNNQGSVKLRFYKHNSAGGITGSRPKISIDNVLVTSTSAGTDTVNPSLVSTSPANSAMDVAQNAPLSITFSEPVVAGAGSIRLFAASNPSNPVQVFTANSGVISGRTVTFAPSSLLSYSTNYFVTVDATAFTDAALNPFVGIANNSSWAFQTIAEPLPLPPSITSLSPAADATNVPAGSRSLEIEFSVNVVRGAGSLVLSDITNSASPVQIASYDVTNTSAVTIENNIVGFSPPATLQVGRIYSITGPAGLFRSASNNIVSTAFGLGLNEVNWAFETPAPDTVSPTLTATSPLNGQGASATNQLSVTFSESIQLAPTWSISVINATTNQSVAQFSNTSSTGVSTGDSTMSILLPSPLALSTSYRVVLSAGIVVDLAGNVYVPANNFAWEFTTAGPFVPGQIVISQVYGGGGNTNSVLKNDFVELHNRGQSALQLNGWSIQYASATGTSWSKTDLSGTIPAGGYFLVQQAAGLGGTTDLPTPDSVGTLALSATNGKVALLNSGTLLTGSSPANNATVSDFVGFGTANAFEGNAPTPALSNTTAAIRKINGSQDTNDNSADFVSGTPVPRNTSSPIFFPTIDGSGVVVASNQSSSAGNLIGSSLFTSSSSAQVVRVQITGSETTTLSSASILVPTDFGVPVAGNVSVTGATTPSISVSGQTITVSNVAITPTNSISVNISGLTAPNISTDLNDSGFRTFTTRTAASGGTLREVVSSPQIRVLMPVNNILTLRTVTLPSPKAYILTSEAIVTYATPSFRNQHWIQDATAGIVIDDQANVLGTSYLRGDGISSVAGSLSEFQGLLQFTPVAAVSSRTSQNNQPVPLVATFAQITSDLSFYQARLVRVNGVSLTAATGNFTNQSIHEVAQGANIYSFRSFTDVDYIGTALPTTSFDLVGLIRTVGTSPVSHISPRSLADIITQVAPPEPGYSDWATQFAGAGAANADFDNDGVPNALEYFFGVNTSGFTPTPVIQNGSISFPRDPNVTDATYVVQTSANLVTWTDVPTGNLDLTNPSAVRYVLPTAQAPLFVRIKVDLVTP